MDGSSGQAFAFHPELADTGRRLSGCRHVRIYHDHAMVKPPGQISRATNWHQDAPYWRIDPVGSFSAWIAVDAHQFLVDDFVRCCHEGAQPPNHVWNAVAYTVPGIVAHESALQGGTLLEIPHLGDPHTS